jgi:hypothetical protein
MLREVQIESLANFVANGLTTGGFIKPKGDPKDIVALLIEFMSENFEIEARIDEETDKMVDDLARKNPGVDVTRLRTLTRQKLAEKKNFVL